MGVVDGVGFGADLVDFLRVLGLDRLALGFLAALALWDGWSVRGRWRWGACGDAYVGAHLLDKMDEVCGAGGFLAAVFVVGGGRHGGWRCRNETAR